MFVCLTPLIIPVRTVMYETELIGLVLRWPVRQTKKRLFVYVLNFDEASPSSFSVIRLLRRGGCFTKKKSITSFFCHARWKVLINRATVHVKNLILMMTFISFFLDMQFLVQAATNFELWLVNVAPSYQVMLRIKMGILFWLVHIQRNKLKRKTP